MFSKAQELAGITLITLGIAAVAGAPAGMIVGGIALLFLGGTTDDVAARAALRRGWGRVRYVWHRQILRERLAAEQTQTSPHPPLHIDPETELWAEQAARSRLARSKASNDRTPALSRHDEDDGLERLA